MGSAVSIIKANETSFNWNGSGNVWANNTDMIANLDHIPAYGSKITTCTCSYQIKRSTASTGAEWNIADDNKSGATTILASGGLSTDYATKSVDLIAKGLVNTTVPGSLQILALKNGYIRWRGSVSTLSGVFKDCRFTLAWTDVVKTLNLIQTTGGTVSYAFDSAINGGSATANKATIPYTTSLVMYTITATPSTGYKFVKWSDGNPNTSRQIIFSGDTVTDSVSISAVFEPLSDSKLYVGTKKAVGVYVGTKKAVGVYLGNTKIL